MFKKSFWVPYEDGAIYPSLTRSMEAITKYCEEHRYSCAFIGDDEVEINDIRYKVDRGFVNGNKGVYGIKCQEK